MRDGTSQHEYLPARHFVGRGLPGYVFQAGHCEKRSDEAISLNSLNQSRLPRRKLLVMTILFNNQLITGN